MLGDPVTSAFSELARRIHASEEGDDVYQAIVDLAVEVVSGCDHASIMLARKGEVSTVASTDPIASAIDEFERILGEGPCLDAIVTEEPQVDPDLAEGSPWSALATQTLALTPVRGAMGFRLLADGRKAGALNLFSDRAGVFTDRSVNEASILASFASIACMTMAAREQSGHLRVAVESNREIGKAVGLLMAAHRVPEERAFEILARTSQELNVKLAEVAARVVMGQQAQYVRPPADS